MNPGVHLRAAAALLIAWLALKLFGEITPIDSWGLLIIAWMNICTFTLAKSSARNVEGLV